MIGIGTESGVEIEVSNRVGIGSDFGFEIKTCIAMRCLSL